MLDIGLFPSICIVATISSLMWLLLSRFVTRNEPDWHDRLKAMVTESSPRAPQAAGWRGHGEAMAGQTRWAAMSRS